MILFVKVFNPITDSFFCRKTFIVERENNLFFNFFDHLLFFVFYDDVFVFKSLKKVNNIFQVKISSKKKSLQLKIKNNVLNISIFWKPKRVSNNYRISLKKPLWSKIWLRYLTCFEHNSELKKPFIQYCAQWDLINVINNMFFLISPSVSCFWIEIDTSIAYRQNVIVCAKSDFRSLVEHGSILFWSGGSIQHHCCLFRPFFRRDCLEAGQIYDINDWFQRFNQIVFWIIEKGN